jgi:hypothetical protein
LPGGEIGFRHLRRTVRRTVVSEDYLEALNALILKGFQTRTKQFAAVPVHHDYASR